MDSSGTRLCSPSPLGSIHKTSGPVTESPANSGRRLFRQSDSGDLDLFFEEVEDGGGHGDDASAQRWPVGWIEEAGMQRGKRCVAIQAGLDAVGVDGAQAEHHDGNLMVLEPEKGEIFTGHGRRPLNNVVF